MIDHVIFWKAGAGLIPDNSPAVVHASLRHDSNGINRVPRT